jgi:hypothetical protein
MEDMSAPAVPTKKPRLMLTVDEELLADLEKWAEQEERTLSNLGAMLLRKAVDEAKKKGILKTKDE